MAVADRRPRWPFRLLAVIVALVLLVGAAEIVLRLLLPDAVKNSVREGLALSPDHPVEVSMGGSAALNALRGGIGDVTIEVPAAPLLEGIEADASMHAGLLPFDPTSGEIRDGEVDLRIGRDQIGSVVSLLTMGVAQTGEVRGDSLVVGRSLEMFGQQVPISASLGLSVTGSGEVVVEPRGVTAAGLDLSRDQLEQAAGGLLEPLLEAQTVCVADRLPEGVRLTDILLSTTGSVTISADLAPDVLSDAATLSETGELRQGSCE